jgi:hypothetical protein
MIRLCRHCRTLFEAVRGYQVFCSKPCGAQFWNAAWKNVHPHPSEHQAWRDMRKRCNNPNHKAYRLYGARGIKIDPRWDSFETFFEDMGPKPSPKYSLEREDNDKGYGPGNCQWATRLEQARNRRQCWTCDEDSELLRGIAGGLSPAQISVIIRTRTPAAVSVRAARLMQSRQA